MHITDGILSLPVVLTGMALAITGVAIGLRNMPTDSIPQVAMLTVIFFVASLVRLPLGVTSVHLVLNGLLGLLLGWIAFPAFFVGLLLQAVLFGFGGLLSLGINICNMALPAIIVFYLFQIIVHKTQKTHFLFLGGFAAGSLAILLATLGMGLSLFFSGKVFLELIQWLWLIYLPVMLVEGVITGFIVVFLHQLRPDLLTLTAVTPNASSEMV